MYSNPKRPKPALSQNCQIVGVTPASGRLAPACAPHDGHVPCAPIARKPCSLVAPALVAQVEGVDNWCPNPGNKQISKHEPQEDTRDSKRAYGVRQRFRKLKAESSTCDGTCCHTDESGRRKSVLNPSERSIPYAEYSRTFVRLNSNLVTPIVARSRHAHVTRSFFIVTPCRRATSRRFCGQCGRWQGANATGGKC
jgi:hypothetical protein